MYHLGIFCPLYRQTRPTMTRWKDPRQLSAITDTSRAVSRGISLNNLWLLENVCEGDKRAQRTDQGVVRREHLGITSRKTPLYCESLLFNTTPESPAAVQHAFDTVKQQVTDF